MDYDRERLLWCKVIIVAFLDAFGKSKKIADIKARREARLWFESKSDDFQTVCYLAGFEPRLIYNWYKRVRHNPNNMLKVLRTFNSSSLLREVF